MLMYSSKSYSYQYKYYEPFVQDGIVYLFDEPSQTLANVHYIGGLYYIEESIASSFESYILEHVEVNIVISFELVYDEYIETEVIGSAHVIESEKKFFRVLENRKSQAFDKSVEIQPFLGDPTMLIFNRHKLSSRMVELRDRMSELLPENEVLLLYESVLVTNNKNLIMSIRPPDYILCCCIK